MSLLLQPVVGRFATDLDGDDQKSLGGGTGCLGDQKSLGDGGEGGRKEESGFLSDLSDVRCKVGGSDDASSESSSIGVPDDSDEEETGSVGDEDEVQSTLSLGSLEESLPTKKGLSNFYTGRSKSFANLADVKSVKDLEKADNPLNKRRRTFLAYKLSSWSASSSSSSSSPSKRRMMMIKDNKRASFYGHRDPISMPLLPVHEQDDEEDEDDDDDDKDGMDNGGGEIDHKRMDLQLGLNRQGRFCI